eukprot:SAG31_NODE_249_length_19118_cov_47.456195_25_plen_184_part_00
MKPGLVWAASVPHGLRLTAVMPDDAPTEYGPNLPTEPSIEVPSSILPGLLYGQSTNTNALYSNQKIALGAVHTFFALVTPIGDALEYATLVGFRPNDNLGVFGYVMGSHFGNPVLFTDDWRPSGFRGPEITSGVPQLCIWRCALTDSSGNPTCEMAVLTEATDALSWTSQRCVCHNNCTLRCS